MVHMPARDVWSRTEILNLARALAIDASPEEKRGLAKMLLALGVEPPVIVDVVKAWRAEFDPALLEK